MSLWRRIFGGGARLPAPPPFLDEPFVPGNELERALLSGDAGAVRAALPAARLFVPSLADVSALSEGDAFRPVVLACDGRPCVAALTSPERLKPLLGVVPGVQGGIDVEGSWVIARCAGQVGLALNPGWRAGIVLAPGELR